MKLFLLSAIIIILNASTWAQQATKSHDFDSTELTRIYNHPFDESKLIGIQQFRNMDNWDSIYYTYRLMEIEATSSSFLDFPLVNRITNEPILFNGNLIFTGETADYGTELFIFNENGIFIRDLKSGTQSSNPNYEIINNELIIYATQSNYRQVFRLNSDLTLNQITFSNKDVQRYIGALNAKTYYSTYNTIDTIVTIVREDSISHNIYELYSTGSQYIMDPIKFNDKLILNARKYYQNSTAYQTTETLIKIDSLGNVFAFIVDSINGLNSFNKYFVFNNELFLLSKQLKDQFGDTLPTLYKTADLVNFEKVLSLDEYHAFFEFIPLNNQIHIITENYYTEQHTINSFDGENLIPLYTHDYHIHYVSEKENLRYYITIVNYDSLYSKLIQVDLNTNDVKIFEVTDSSDHPPYFTHAEQGAAWINNTLYFIDGNWNYNHQISNDIYRLDSELGLQESITTESVEIYPNPVYLEDLKIYSTHNIPITIYSTQGEKLIDISLSKGLNNINVSGLNSGTYFVKIGEYTKKFIKFD